MYGILQRVLASTIHILCQQHQFHFLFTPPTSSLEQFIDKKIYYFITINFNTSSRSTAIQTSHIRICIQTDRRAAAKLSQQTRVSQRSREHTGEQQGYKSIVINCKTNATCVNDECKQHLLYENPDRQTYGRTDMALHLEYKD